MTTTNRSDYLGVYNNTSDHSKAEVPFRVAIKLMNQGKPNWTNLGYTKSEAVAARIYNMYAINFFGKGAIINDVDLSLEEKQEFEAFVTNPEKPKRQVQLEKARTKAHAVLDAGHVFRVHTDLRKVAV